MIHWSPDPVLVHLGPVQIRWYGLLFLSGFYIGLYFMQRVCRYENKSSDKLDTLLVYMIAGTTIGARLAHCFFYEWDYYSQHLLEILMIWKGGLASHGGGAGVVLALFLFSKRYPEFSFSWLCDRMALPLVFTGALIRLGNLMNSEIVGQPTNLPWAFVFDRVDQVPRHPTQIYESLWYFATWLIGIWLYRKFKHHPPTGLLFGWVVTAIFVGRILIELIKENQEAFEANMTLNMGQYLSIPWLLVGAFLFIRALKKARDEAKTENTTSIPKKPKKV